MTDMSPEALAPRRRATSTSLATAKAARGFASRYTARLADWHMQLAHLRARAMRSDTAFVRAQVEPLLAEVSEQRRRFVEDAEAEVDAVRSHSVVRDLERALLRLENELRHLTAGPLDATSAIRPLNAGEAAIPPKDAGRRVRTIRG
jgi:hypothetical protein